MWDMNLVQGFPGLRALLAEPLVVGVELVLIGLSVNWVASILHGTRGTRPLRGVLTLLVVAALVINVLAERSGWERLSLLYHYFLLGLAFVAVVAFQPELRRAVIRAGDVRFLRRGTPQSRVVAALVQSARYLSRNRYGGLIAIQRAVDLGGWAEKGTLINADVSANLLNTIFFPNTPLHDLGVIIAGKRLLAANCQFPLAESDEVGAAVGSRHLAAVGMSFETDALVLVVSEETGTISLADAGKLTRYLSLDDLSDELTGRLSGQPIRIGTEEKTALPRLSRLWRRLRRAAIVVPLTIVIWTLAYQASLTTLGGVDVELALRSPEWEHIVDREAPVSGRFKVTFQGPARAIERLRSPTQSGPLRLDWELSKRDLNGPYVRDAEDLINGLPQVQKLEVVATEVLPLEVRYSVDERVSIKMGVRAATGAVKVTDERFDPPEVEVTMRARHVDSTAGGLPESQWILALPLEDRLRRAAAGETITERVAVPTQVGSFPIETADPEFVTVSLRVAGQRITRSLDQIPVWVLISPELLQSVDVQRVDPQEWLIALDVAGDKTQIEALRPSDVRAFVAITSDMLTTTPQLRSEVKFDVPPGVEVVGPKRYVQLQLDRREGRVP